MHDATSFTYARTNRVMPGGELGNFQPYLSREERSRLEPPNEHPTNPVHQNFHAQAETLSFKANSDNQENLENSHKKLKQIDGPCMECGGDHWMKDCPHRQVPVIIEPGETKVQMGPCIECGGDHWRKDCPHRDPLVVNKTAEANIPFLPIERYCEECYLEHLPRPSKAL